VALAGFMTHLAVESTAREARDRDYGVAVLEDCCGDADTRAHDHTLRRVLPAFGWVTTAPAFLADLEAALAQRRGTEG
jgi:nicotinamidase-related amidase